MPSRNPADIAAKWSRNLQGSTQQIQTGVTGVTVSPTALAAKQADAYLMGVQSAVQDGKWQAGLNRVSLQDWQQAMITKGIPRIQQGATTGKNKVESFMNEFMPFVESSQRALAATPRGGLEQNVQRMVTWTRQMATFRRNR